MFINKLFLAFFSVLFFQPTVAQTWDYDNFTIGIYTYTRSVESWNMNYLLAQNGPQGNFFTDLNHDYYQDSFINGSAGKVPTSVFNRFKEDGVNTVLLYFSPGIDLSKRMLTLAQRNDIRLIFDYKGNFVPLNAPEDSMFLGHVEGKFIFRDQESHERSNLKGIYDSVFLNANFKDGLWGIQIAEEPSAIHQYAIDSIPTFCIQNFNQIGCASCGVPPKVLADASDTFNSWNQCSMVDVPFIISEAAHGGIIDNHSEFWDAINNGAHGPYRPQHYIIPDSMHTIPKVYMNSSYVTHHQNISNHSRYIANDTTNTKHRAHYLGRYKTIDFVKKFYDIELEGILAEEWGWGVSNRFSYGISNITDTIVQANIESYLDVPNAVAYHLHSNLSNDAFHDSRNGNAIWFQSYTSIIHGTQGLIFWKFPNWRPTYQDSVNHSLLGKLHNSQNPFNHDYFPETYNDFLSPLIREISYLSEKGFIGLVSKILYNKTDKSDDNCIVPHPNNYMNQIEGLDQERKDEFYGLRYTINANPSGEVIMIVTNPLNYKIDSVWLDFSSIGNQQIAQADSAEILFTLENNPNSNYYKIARSATIIEDGELKTSYKVALKGDSLQLAFGPLDVHVIKFVPNIAVNTQFNHWEKEWTNDGDGMLDGATIQANDTFYIGDFIGADYDQLIVMQTNANDKWVSMHSYSSTNKDWTWIWSNNADPQHPLLKYKNHIVVGDFNGNGQDDLFGYNPVTGMRQLFEFNLSTLEWDLLWTVDTTSHFFHSYREHFVSGDYDGDGISEVLCYNNPGWITEYKYDLSDFNWGWSDLGFHYMQNFRNEYLRVGDYNGDGNDELIGFNDYVVALFDFNLGIYHWDTIWSTNPVNVGGWGPPLGTDVILSGNIDLDPLDELVFIQTGPSAGWALSTDYHYDPVIGKDNWLWNWSANNVTSIEYIRDWPIKESNGTNTEYFLFRPSANTPKYLIAKRRYGCNPWAYKHLISMYYTQTGYNYKAQMSNVDQIEKERTNHNILVMPNPANEYINISLLDKTDQIKELIVYDLSGKIVIKKNMINTSKTSISVKDLKKGTYILKVESGHTSSSKRIVIN